MRYAVCGVPAFLRHGQEAHRGGPVIVPGQSLLQAVQARFGHRIAADDDHAVADCPPLRA